MSYRFPFIANRYLVKGREKLEVELPYITYMYSAYNTLNTYTNEIILVDCRWLGSCGEDFKLLFLF